MGRKTIDPSLVAEALREGRTLIADYGPNHFRVTLGPPSKYPRKDAA